MTGPGPFWDDRRRAELAWNGAVVQQRLAAACRGVGAWEERIIVDNILDYRKFIVKLATIIVFQNDGIETI